MQQTLEVIEGADRVVTQHLVEFLRNGITLPGRHTGSKDFPAMTLFAPTDTTHSRKSPWGLLDTDRRTARLGVGRSQAPGLTTQSTKA